MTNKSEIQNKEKWYTRPVFSVTDINASLHHYCELLGFVQAWDYKENDRTIVTQVDRGELELILTENLDRFAKSCIFISLTSSELKTLLKQIQEKEIPSKRSFWGYPIIQLEDPDGNEMLFPLDDT